MESGAVADGRHVSSKRRRTLISCTECHRRKQKVRIKCCPCLSGYRTNTDSQIQCDRCQPCQNCVKRRKLNLCRYEKLDNSNCNSVAANASSAGSGQGSIKPSTTCADPQSLHKANQLSPQDHENLVDTLGYSAHNAHSTFGLVNKVEAAYSSISSPVRPTDASKQKKTAIDDKYRSLVRQLPSKEYIDILVQQFFTEINWQYDVLDEITFYQQLGSWRRLPYSAHRQGIGSLPAEALAFPSLTFQLMAHSLIHQPVGERAGPNLDSLKYAMGMTFVDLANEFSDAGYSMIGSMEKKDISLLAVQSGILRASFLKNTGKVTEAWHVVGTAIRNAQEIGLHAIVAAQNPLASIDAQWDHEMRRRVWFVLHNWDIHMAVVLGRPMATIMAAATVDIPDDLARRESGKPPQRRTEHDPPTPSSMIRIGYDIAYQYFPQVRELEERGARMEDYHLVRETHAAVVGNMDRIPRWCRCNDSDVHFDDLPGCHWLPAARQSLTSGIHFVLLSLHRPYIFSVSESRTEALNAACMVFTAQRRLFHLSEPGQHLSFNTVYPLFDTMVISLAILILFPHENWDMRSRLIDNVHWGIDVLAKIGQYNDMAQSANDVVKTLLSRLEEGPRLSLPHSNHNSEEGATRDPGSRTADLHIHESLLNTSFSTNNLSASNPAESLTLSNDQTRLTVSTSLDFDVDTVLPPRPVSDLFYQDIYAPVSETLQGVESPGGFLQFEGNYSDESFWSFMNDLSHA